MAKIDPQAKDLIVKINENKAIRYYVAQEEINLKDVREKYTILSKEVSELNKILTAPLT